MRVEAFGPELAIERLDIAVVRRLARSGEVERHAALIGPEIEIARDELGALVNPDGVREAMLPANLLKYINNIRPSEVEPDIQRRREAREGVDNGEHAELASRRQLIVHEVHRLYLIRPCGWAPILPQLRLDPALRCFVAELKPQLLVKTIDPLRIDIPTLPSEQHMNPPEAVAHSRLGKFRRNCAKRALSA